MQTFRGAAFRALRITRRRILVLLSLATGVLVRSVILFSSLEVPLPTKASAAPQEAHRSLGSGRRGGAGGNHQNDKPTVSCIGRSDAFPGNRTCLFENVWFSDGAFSGGPELGGPGAPEERLHLNNRWSGAPWSISNSSRPPGVNRTVPRCLLLLEGFSANPGHTMFDFVYPSWSSLLAFRPDLAVNGTWQWVTTGGIVRRMWWFRRLEAFSGHPPVSVRELRKSGGGAPFDVPCLLAGSGGRGIGAVGRDGLAGLGPATAPGGGGGGDPIRAFRDRFYDRFGVPRPAPVAGSAASAAASGRYVTVVEQKRPLRGAAGNASLAADALGMRFRSIRWEGLTFEGQLEVCSSTAVLVVGVGTARTNSFLLPDGAVEVQTCTPASWAVPRRRHCFDAHIGTLPSHVKVVHVEGYSEAEAAAKSAPAGLRRTIEEAAAMLPLRLPVDRAMNLPLEIRAVWPNLTVTFPEMFDIYTGWCMQSPRPRDCVLRERCFDEYNANDMYVPVYIDSTRNKRKMYQCLPKDTVARMGTITRELLNHAFANETTPFES